MNSDDSGAVAAPPCKGRIPVYLVPDIVLALCYRMLILTMQYAESLHELPTVKSKITMMKHSKEKDLLIDSALGEM